MIKENLLKVLHREKEARLKGGIYHKLQIEMTYNSNHMEGSELTHDQTRFIFETKTILTEKNIKIDDIIETKNHFQCIDLVIDFAKKKLTESFIKKLHFTLKKGTTDEEKSWFKVGDYKLLPNEVGERETTHPKDVSREIKKILQNYHKKKEIKIKDIIDFHVKFERIHPFQDGNGRVGRLIAFKECLKHNIVPFFIKDDFKMFYYRGLKEWDRQKGFLMDTCLHGQDIMKSFLDYFEI